MRDTVAAPIEEQVSGVEGMMYMSSQSTNDGTYRLSVTFKLGMDSDMAQVLVQNRVSLALPVIPQLVQNEGITVKKISPNTLMIVNLVSPDNRYDNIFLSNYATIYIRDELGRLPGVADVTYFGQRDYSLRAWLDPDKLAALNLTATDVVAAIAQQNLQVAAGQIGQEPVPKGQQFQLTINTLGRLVDPEQFADIIVKAGQAGAVAQTLQTAGATDQTAAASQTGGTSQTAPAGKPLPPAANTPQPQSTGIVRLRDVARVVLGSQQYDQSCTLDGRPSVALNVFQLPDSNALDVAGQVYAKMKELRTHFPDGLDYQIVYDTTPFVRESVAEVFYTLRDAVILVSLVMLVFLQSWRAAIIPLIAVPVAIVGTFAVMAALGFSLNNLSLFGLVLAIGIVVDDAIVVVENIERWLDMGVPPREAARKAMDEVTGPVIAVGLVLFAVFIPAAFLGGISGQFFRQFAVTIAVSTVISAFNSLTLSPALAAILLRPRGSRRDPITWLLDMLLGWFFRLFNVAFGASTAAYVRVVGGLLRISLVTMVVYGGLLALTYWQFNRTPAGFIPQQDKGYLLLNVQLPDSASVERTQKVMAQIETIVRATPGVDHTVGISGQSLILGANAPNLGSMYVLLKEFAERRGPGAFGRRNRRGDPRALPARRAGGHRLGLRRTADRRPGHHRRLQDDRRGPRQSRPRRTPAGERSDRRPGQPHARPARAVQQLAGAHPLAVSRHRPHQVHGLGRAGQRRFQHAPNLPGLVLRQQLQRVRPHLAGERPGRSALPQQGSRYPAAPGPQQPRADDSAGVADAGARHQRAGHGDALQHVLRHRHQRQHHGRASARARRST